jgi:23S rRNA (uracil1939-C5)-methyltransferase
MSQHFVTDISIGEDETNKWHQGELIELEIVDLADSGDGVGRFAGRVVFVSDTVIGDRVIVRLVKVKPKYANAKLLEVVKSSGDRVRPRCIVADKCGGCQWLQIDYQAQLEAKRNQVIQALQRIGGFEDLEVNPVLPSADLGYRNKVTFPLKRSATGQVQAGYYQKGSHQLVNLNQCPVQDDRFNPILTAMKQDIYDRGWSIYDETEHRGKLRHLSLRIGKYTGEILLTLVTTDLGLVGLEDQAKEWLERYPDLMGVCINVNPARSNVIFGPETNCVAGLPYLREEFAGLRLQLLPETFFQVNTEAAEGLLSVVMERLNLQGHETLIDAYCGVGTFTLPLAKKVKQAIGLEVQTSATDQAKINAELNNIKNASFLAGAVEKLLPEISFKPDVVLLDPPRQGCDRAVIDGLLEIQPKQIVYISCRPATLARDLKLLCEGGYKITFIQPADFFPQTPHVECAVFLEKQ